MVGPVWKHLATPPPVESDFFATLRYVGLALLAATLLVLRLLPRPDPAPPPGQGADQWWVTSQGRLITMWATMEGARSEERRVGKECRARWTGEREKQQ